MTLEYMYWNNLRGLPINVKGQGRKIGVVEDFYYEPGTHSINALRVNAGLKGYRILLASAIESIDNESITVANEYRLIDETNAGPIYQMPLGDRLLNYRVTNDQGETLGKVTNLYLGIYPPLTLRISAIELEGRNHTRISAPEITHFGNDELTITEHAGKNLHQ